jgi:RNA polymerase sigma factor (sigma-70 family)
MHSEQKAWLDAAARVPLLTHEEEIILGRQVQSAIGSTDRLVLRRAHRARERLATANLRLVYKVADPYRGYVPDYGFTDLLQAGAEGVMHAASKFDPALGFRFSTYAAIWIRQRIQIELDRHSRTIRAPSTITPQLRRLPRVQQQLTAELGRPPTVDELAAGLRLAPVEVVTALQRARPPTSLDQVLDDDSDTTIGDLQATPAEVEDEQLEQLRQGMARLPAQLRRLVDAAYLPGEPTLAQQARAEGMSLRKAKGLVEAGLGRLRLLREAPEEQLHLPLLLPRPSFDVRRRVGKRHHRKRCQCPAQQLELVLVRVPHHGSTLRRLTSTS